MSRRRVLCPRRTPPDAGRALNRLTTSPIDVLLYHVQLDSHFIVTEHPSWCSATSDMSDSEEDTELKDQGKVC